MLKPTILDKLLFPEILWQRPVNIHQRKGRVLILGGEKEIKKAITVCEVLFYAQIQKISLGYPNVLSSIYQKILPEEFHFPLPASKEKTLSIGAFQKIQEKISDYDLLVAGSGLSKSQETQNLIKKISRFNLPILFTKEGFFAQKRLYPTILFLDSFSAASFLKKKPNEVEENPLQSLEKLISEFKQVVVLVFSERVLIGFSEMVVITQVKIQEEILLGLISAFWSFNLKKPLESTCTACYVAKIWQENFNKLSQIEKAINKAEFVNF